MIASQNFPRILFIGFIILRYLGHSILGQVDVSLPLELALDARSAALGGKLAADILPDGQTASYNPAATDSSSLGIVHVSYLNYFAGIQLGSVDAVVRNNKNRTWHVGARFASFGKFAGYDASGVATGDFSGGDYTLQSGVTWRIDSVWTAGVNVWGGFRNLARENAGILGSDFALMRRWPEKHMAVGILLSSIGRQFAGTGSQPVGWMPWNFQLGITKGFDHAPFQIYLQASHLENWNLAPEGTYNDDIDPLTGDVIPNSKWILGDQFARHLSAGVEIKMGNGLAAQVGYDHRRRTEMVASGRKGTNGLALGIAMKLGEFDLRLARNTYHFIGSSTHLTIAFLLPGK